MKAKSSKKYLASRGPVECHIKTIDAPFDYSDDKSAYTPSPQEEFLGAVMCALCLSMFFTELI